MAAPGKGNDGGGGHSKDVPKSPRKVRFSSTRATAGTSTTGTIGTGNTNAATTAGTDQSNPQFTTPAQPVQVGPTPSIPGLYVHTSDNPQLPLNQTFGTTTLGNETCIRVPHQQFIAHNQGAFVQNTTIPGIPGTTLIGANPAIPTQPGFYTMSEPWPNSQNPPAGAVHFQPQVPDTTHGPIQHVYMPRQDAPAFMVPGQAPHGMIITPPQAIVHGGPAVIQHPPTVQGGGVNIMAAQQPPIVMPVGPPPAPMYGNCNVMAPNMPGGGYPAYMVGGPGGPVFYPPGGGGGGGYPMPQPVHGTVGFPPDVTGVGRTILENQALGAQEMERPRKQLEMAPRNASPSRIFWCREIDGNWTQRSFFSIEKMGEREWTWYWNERDKDFYAVRLRSG